MAGAPVHYNQPIIVQQDGTKVNTEAPVELPDGFPTACVHSQFGIACYGIRPSVTDLKAVSGLTPFRKPGAALHTPRKRGHNDEGGNLPFGNE
jgi:hypothetical protein